MITKSNGHPGGPLLTPHSWFVKRNVSKLIIACRDTSKGEAAKKNIESSVANASIIEVWALDLSSYDSVKAFAARADKLDRLDILCENAGIAAAAYRLAEEDESTITVNVVSTYLLGLLLLPKLRETGRQHNILPKLVITSSEVHFQAQFAERNSNHIFKTLSDQSTANMDER